MTLGGERGKRGGEGARAAWRVWLAAQARDPEVALAAALAYQSLDDTARDAWLDALRDDGPEVGVPAVALYAPLLGVEEDSQRRARIVAAMGTTPCASPRPWAVAGDAKDRDGTWLLLVLPLYLGFAELLACRLRPEGGVADVVHEPLVEAGLHRGGNVWEGISLREIPFDVAVEDLAHAVVAERRRGELPEALVRFADLFDLPRRSGA